MYRIVRIGSMPAERDGAAAVEVALLLPFFLLLLVGIMQFAWMLLLRHSMLHAAREGARVYAVQGGSNGDAETRSEALLNELFGAASSDFGVTTSQNGRDRIVTVTVPYSGGVVDVGGGIDMIGILNGLSGFIPGAEPPVNTGGSMTAQVAMRSEEQ